MLTVADIDAMLSEGLPFEHIEARIEAADMHPEYKNALWLLAWVETSPADRRRAVREMAALL